MNAVTTPTKPVKPIKKPAKIANQLSRTFVVTTVATAVLITVSVLGVLTWGANRAAQSTAQAIDSAMIATVSAIENAGRYMTFALAEALTKGTDEQRLEVLTQLEQAEWGNSSVPEKIADAIKANLEHDNEKIRSAAAAVLAKIEANVSSDSVDQPTEDQ